MPLNTPLTASFFACDFASIHLISPARLPAVASPAAYAAITTVQSTLNSRLTPAASSSGFLCERQQPHDKREHYQNPTTIDFLTVVVLEAENEQSNTTKTKQCTQAVSYCLELKQLVSFRSASLILKVTKLSGTYCYSLQVTRWSGICNRLYTHSLKSILSPTFHLKIT